MGTTVPGCRHRRSVVVRTVLHADLLTMFIEKPAQMVVLEVSVASKSDY
jgi:hypothetical protein